MSTSNILVATSGPNVKVFADSITAIGEVQSVRISGRKGLKDTEGNDVKIPDSITVWNFSFWAGHVGYKSPDYSTAAEAMDAYNEIMVARLSPTNLGIKAVQ